MPYVGHARRVASYVDPAHADAVVAGLLQHVIEDTDIDASEPGPGRQMRTVKTA